MATCQYVWYFCLTHIFDGDGNFVGNQYVSGYVCQCSTLSDPDAALEDLVTQLAAGQVAFGDANGCGAESVAFGTWDDLLAGLPVSSVGDTVTLVPPPPTGDQIPKCVQSVPPDCTPPQVPQWYCITCEDKPHADCVWVCTTPCLIDGITAKICPSGGMHRGPTTKESHDLPDCKAPSSSETSSGPTGGELWLCGDALQLVNGMLVACQRPWKGTVQPDTSDPFQHLSGITAPCGGFCKGGLIPGALIVTVVRDDAGVLTQYGVSEGQSYSLAPNLDNGLTGVFQGGAGNCCYGITVVDTLELTDCGSGQNPEFVQTGFTSGISACIAPTAILTADGTVRYCLYAYVGFGGAYLSCGSFGFSPLQPYPAWGTDHCTAAPPAEVIDKDCIGFNVTWDVDNGSLATPGRVVITISGG